MKRTMASVLAVKPGVTFYDAVTYFIGRAKTHEEADALKALSDCYYAGDIPEFDAKAKLLEITK